MQVKLLLAAEAGGRNERSRNAVFVAQRTSDHNSPNTVNHLPILQHPFYGIAPVTSIQEWLRGFQQVNQSSVSVGKYGQVGFAVSETSSPGYTITA